MTYCRDEKQIEDYDDGVRIINCRKKQMFSLTRACVWIVARSNGEQNEFKTLSGCCWVVVIAYCINKREIMDGNKCIVLLFMFS